jgi:hypothetical protein
VVDFQGPASGVRHLRRSGSPPPTSPRRLPRANFLGTVRGRIGWAEGHWRLDGSGGLTYGNRQHLVRRQRARDGVCAVLGLEQQHRLGWALGAGVNDQLDRGVGLSALRSRTHQHERDGTFEGFSATHNLEQRIGGDIVRGVINYKF